MQKEAQPDNCEKQILASLGMTSREQHALAGGLGWWCKAATTEETANERQE